MNKLKLCILVIGTILVAGGFGFLGYSAFFYHQAYALSQTQLKRAQSSLASSVMQYGTVRSVDPANRTIEVEAPNSYEPGTSILYRLPVLSDAFVAQQMLVEQNGAYTSVSSTTPGTIEALVPGTRVKFLVLSRNTGSAIMYLLYGDPL